MIPFFLDLFFGHLPVQLTRLLEFNLCIKIEMREKFETSLALLVLHMYFMYEEARCYDRYHMYIPDLG